MSGPSSAGGLGVYVSSDGGYAVWLRHWSLLGVSVSGTVYHVVDVDAGTIVTEGGFGPRMQADLTLEPAAFCLFAVPTTVTAPAEGGNVAIPVIPGPTCRSWTAPAALNPGPHPGAATLLIPVAPNPGPSLRELSSQVGGQTTLIQQGSATPGPPEARLELTGNRATLTWSPTFGAGITSWVLRGAWTGRDNRRPRDQGRERSNLDVAGAPSRLVHRGGRRGKRSRPQPGSGIELQRWGERQAGRPHRVVGDCHRRLRVAHLGPIACWSSAFVLSDRSRSGDRVCVFPRGDDSDAITHRCPSAARRLARAREGADSGWRERCLGTDLGLNNGLHRCPVGTPAPLELVVVAGHDSEMGRSRERIGPRIYPRSGQQARTG